MANSYRIRLISCDPVIPYISLSVNCSTPEIIDYILKSLKTNTCCHDDLNWCINCGRRLCEDISKHKAYMKQIFMEISRKLQRKSIKIVGVANSTYKTKDESASNKFTVQKYSECKFLCSIPEERNTKDKEEIFQRNLRVSGVGDKDLARKIVTIFNCDM